MPTNGSSKRKEPQGFLGEDLVADETRLQPLFTGYVGYEQLVGTLIAAAGEAGLRLFDASSTLDTTTLERRFSASCAPAEWMPPLELWAETRFFWPAEYTALSLYGDEVICDLYHEENVACKHRNRQANLFTEMEIEYLLPYEFVRQLDSDEGVEKTARRIRQLFIDIVEHDNIVAVEAKALYTGDQLHLSSIKAGHIWVLEDELAEQDSLKEALQDICEEMRTVLLRFVKEFGPPKEKPRE